MDYYTFKTIKKLHQLTWLNFYKLLRVKKADTHCCKFKRYRIPDVWT